MRVPPFMKLARPREVSASLPPDLVRFYRLNEGLGVKSMEADLKFFKLSELADEYRIKPADLNLGPFGQGYSGPGWRSFQAIGIALDLSPALYCYVMSCPFAKSGSIMAFGLDGYCVGGGLGGTGKHAQENSVVVAADFDSWVARLQEDDWEEYGLTPDAFAIPYEKQATRIKLFSSLNPLSEWADFL